MSKITLIESYLEWVRSCNTVDVGGLTWTQHHLFFRGQSNKQWKLTPPIFREKDISNEIGIIRRNEYQLIQDAYRHAWKYLQDYPSDLEKMIVLQHYGLRTRLLDLTSNPLIALYFACADVEGPRRDGKVFCFCPDEEERLRISKAIARVVANGVNRGIGLSRYLKKEYDEFYFRGRNAPIITKSFELWQKELYKPQFFLAPYNNHRITAQRGTFIIAPLNEYDDASEGSGYKVGAIESTGIWKSILVSAASKSMLLDELALLGIDESTVYPDLEHLLRFLNNKHQPNKRFVPTW